MMRKVVLLACAVVLAVVQAYACAAITKKGTQCKRAPSPGSEYCWQHGGTTKAQRAAGMTEEDVAKARCKAITRAGTQCKRTSTPGADFCWQHAGAQTAKREAETVVTTKEIAADAKTTASPKKTSAAESVVERVQCDATTKAGKRCARKAQPGGTKCWQHAQ